MSAYLIDMLICGVATLTAGFTERFLRVLGFWTPPDGSSGVSSFRALGKEAQLAVMISYIVALGLFYFAFFEASPWQASIGKRLLDLYVTDSAGRRLGFGRSFSRSLAKCVSMGFYVGAVSILMIGLNEQKEALHDGQIAGEVIVRHM
jgi:uncharacterized RDD family membrane protein YckC